MAEKENHDDPDLVDFVEPKKKKRFAEATSSVEL